MFKLPKLPRSSSTKAASSAQTYKGIPCFNYDDVTSNKLIAAGGYGEVFLGRYKGEDVVLKVLTLVDKKDLVKEARFLHYLDHENLVKFKAMCLTENTLMLEYVAFNFNMFGKDKTVSSLDGLLTELNKNELNGFEHLFPCIADQVVDGLIYLHSHGVAHRDLKPGNILVSNQHLQNSSLNDDEKRKLWTTDPCHVKLTDFGESWGSICETSQVLKTHTANIYKGTPAFMAPEIVNSAKRPDVLSEEQLKMADVWSLGMLFFCLLNPDCPVPYLKEASKQQRREWVDYIAQKTATGCLPEQSVKYEQLRAANGIHINSAFLACIKVDPLMRQNIHEIKTTLNQKDKSGSTFPFKIHQGTALLQAQEEHTGSGPFILPKNDGTNACTFLSLKNAEMLLEEKERSWEEIKDRAESLILEFPEKINELRDETRAYEVDEAYNILRSGNLIEEHELSDRCEGHRVFSNEGMKELADLLSRNSGVFIVIVPPLSFVLGRIYQKWVVVDTHVIGEVLGGNGNGVLKIFGDNNSTKRWIWRRLAQSNVRASMLGITEISRCQKSTGCLFISSGRGSNKDSTTDDLISISDVGVSVQHPHSGAPSQGIHRKSCAKVHDGRTSSVEVLDEQLEGSLHNETDKNVSLTNKTSTVTNDNQVPAHTFCELDEPSTWEGMQSVKWGPNQLPYFNAVDRKLQINEAFALANSKCTKSRRVPQGCRNNAIFIIDSDCVRDPDDVKSDLNGVFSICHEIKCLTLTVKIGDTASIRSRTNAVRLKVQSRQRIDAQDGCLYLKIHRRENQFGLVRNIMYFMDVNEKIVNKSIILQYFINKKVCGNVDFISYSVPPHGNASKKRRSGFHPLKKSTLKRMRDEVSPTRKCNSDRVYEHIMEGIKMGADFGDKPRSKKQIADHAVLIKARHKPINEVEEILAYNAELGNAGIILHHSDLPSDLWVLATKSMLSNFKNAEGGYPLSIDPTFNHGMYEVTAFTYRHHLVESKSRNIPDTWNNAIMVGPTIIQHDKSEATYDKAIREIARYSSLSDKSIGIVTDGEVALIKACESNFRRATSLRCTRHFHANCKDFLSSIGIKGLSADPFLDIVFGDDGIVDAVDKDELKTRLKTVKPVLNEMEAEILKHEGDFQPKFYDFLKDREKSVLRRLIQDARKKGGMPLTETGKPIRVYTNQSETVNSMLSARKTSLGFSKKDDLTKTQFIKDVWEYVVKMQEEEVEKALYGSSAQFRLTKEARYLQVSIEEWYQWTAVQQKEYLSKFNNLSAADVKNKKAIPLPEDVQNPHLSKTPLFALSVKLSDALPFLSFANVIEEKALEILNATNGVVVAPHLDFVENEKHFLVAGGSPEPYAVKIKKNNKITCNCKGFKYSGICRHAAAVAEKQNLLQSLISNVKISQRATITYPDEKKGAGRKGGQPRRSRVYDRGSEQNESEGNMGPPFTEIWHNNEPFIVCHVNSIPKDKNKCGFCSKEFPQGLLAIMPFDIALKHKERWLYPNRGRKENEPAYLPSPGNKLTTRYYCINTVCIYQRFPYFRQELLEIPQELHLKESHKKLLQAL
ncbi:Serine/threonine-protein kinase TAO1 [Holothuria leucospilota]|uniref:Serine/threonine-protein kinase TAO1 n=1 Tax=Holothuria leucospilota TaxID=206669 RepID=A0A9Q1CM41_HOLLE|nr:Serine/threonine-protein kinase TAO1 [Holothuria leucospilota]